jgi:hypothetical protein
MNKKLEAVLIEYRKFPQLEFIIRNAINKLGNEWSFTVVCGNLNYEFIVELCANISPNIKIIKRLLIQKLTSKNLKLCRNLLILLERQEF